MKRISMTTNLERRMIWQPLVIYIWSSPFIAKDWIFDVWTVNRDDPTCYTLGSVVTKKGYCIAFPNIQQHQVRLFQLEDKPKPGHCKILVLFSIKPSFRVSAHTRQRHPASAESETTSTPQSCCRAGCRSGCRTKRLPLEVYLIMDPAESLTSREVEEYKSRFRPIDERGPTSEAPSIMASCSRHHPTCASMR